MFYFVSVTEKSGFQSPYGGMDNGMVSLSITIYILQFRSIYFGIMYATCTRAYVSRVLYCYSLSLHSHYLRSLLAAKLLQKFSPEQASHLFLPIVCCPRIIASRIILVSFCLLTCRFCVFHLGSCISLRLLYSRIYFFARI